MVNRKEAAAGGAELEPATAPNPKVASPEDSPATSDGPIQHVPQPVPYPGRVVRFVSHDQFMAAAHTGEADYSPAIIARVMPTKGPDDAADRCDLVVFDPEREGGSYVERNASPFDGTGPGYAVLDQPMAMRFGVEALKPIVALIIEDYLAQRDKDDARYDEDSIKQLVADELAAITTRQSKKKE